MDKIREQLLEKFLPKEIEWRVQSSSLYNNRPQVIIVTYLKSKAIKDRLDLIFGWENWETKFIPIEKGFICELTITFNDKKIVKSDGASYTNIEAVKGGMSDSFKRASKMLGIGRYLDACGSVFAACSLTKGGMYTEYTKTKDGKYIYWAKPTKQSTTTTTPTTTTTTTPTPTITQPPTPTTPAPTTTPTQNNSDYTVTPPQLKRLYAISMKNNWSEDNIKDYIKTEFDIDSKKDLLKSQYDKLIAAIEEVQEAAAPPNEDDFLPPPVPENYYAKPIERR